MAGGRFYYCGWCSRLPERPATKMQTPAPHPLPRARCVGGPSPAAKRPRKASKELVPAPSLQSGWLDRPGSSQPAAIRGTLTPLPPPPAPGSRRQVARRARRYLGRRVLSGDGGILSRAGRRLGRGATAPGLGLGRCGVLGRRRLRALLLSGAPGAHGSSVVLARPAAGLRLPQVVGLQPEREVVRLPGPGSALPSVVLRTRADCE